MFADEEIKPQKGEGLPRNLENLSVTDMQEYIAELKLEIFRTEAEIGRRGSHKLTAEALFKRDD